MKNALTDVLSLEHISKTFADGAPVISDVSLSVKRGEVVSIVGPSGCGKSTLLRIAARLETQTTGTSSVDTHGLGYVFQDPTLLPWRTVRANIGLLAELQHLDSTVMHARVDEAIALVGLQDHQNKYPRQLSGGMRMRVSLARSLVLHPHLFLFDEPFSALDEINRQRLNDELLKLFEQQQFGVLFVTHSVTEAVYLSSKIHVMSSRPGMISHTVEIPFGYPREADLRFDSSFGLLALEVSHALRETES